MLPEVAKTTKLRNEENPNCGLTQLANLKKKRDEARKAEELLELKEAEEKEKAQEANAQQEDSISEVDDSPASEDHGTPDDSEDDSPVNHSTDFTIGVPPTSQTMVVSADEESEQDEVNDDELGDKSTDEQPKSKLRVGFFSFKLPCTNCNFLVYLD